MPNFMRLSEGTASPVNSDDPTSWNFGSSGGAASAGSSSKPVQHVYMGSRALEGGGNQAQMARPGKPTIYDPTFKKAKGVLTVDDASQQWYKMSDSDREMFAQYAERIGLLSHDDARNFGEVKKAWDKSVNEAANWYSAGKQVTPWQAALLLASPPGTSASSASQYGRSSAGTSGGGGGAAAAQPSLAGTRTQRSVSVNLTDPETARAIVSSAMHQYLGQDPSDEQVSAFTQTLNAYERNNPSVQTVKTTYDSAGNVTNQKSTSRGGATQQGEEDLIKHQTQSLPDYGAYQAATTYMNWLEAALGSPVGN